MNKAVLLLVVFVGLALSQTPFCGYKTCANPNNPAHACWSLSGNTSSCPVGYACTSGKCAKLPAAGSVGQCITPGPAGSNPCYSDTQDLLCNGTSRTCIVKPNPIGVGGIGCQNPGCGGLLECVFNQSYPGDGGDPQAWVCMRGNQGVGQTCQYKSDCQALLLCDSDTQKCYARYSKAVGASCSSFYECSAGLTCKQGTCQTDTVSAQPCNAYSGAGSCPDADETCTCPVGSSGGEQATCQWAWTTPVSTAYANAELNILECFWKNCPAIDSWGECPACNKTLCLWYDQLALNGQMVARNHTNFFCQNPPAHMNDINVKIDPNWINTVCGLGPLNPNGEPNLLTTTTSTPASTGATGSATSSGAALLVSAASLLAVAAML